MRRYFLIALTSPLLNGCLRAKSAKATMSEETFWSIINAARGQGGERAHTRRLSQALEKRTADEVLSFYLHYQRFFDLADRGDIWAAGVLLNGGHGSDDGFAYFRNWLIAQGAEVLHAALANPDSLADVLVEVQDGVPTAEWESFGYVAYDIYEVKTKSNLYEAAAPVLRNRGPRLPRFDWRQYENEFMQQKLPRLWARWSKFKLEFDRRTGG
jgi:Protein of unknown function (DUF4240)